MFPPKAAPSAGAGGKAGRVAEDGGSSERLGLRMPECLSGAARSADAVQVCPVGPTCGGRLLSGLRRTVVSKEGFPDDGGVLSVHLWKCQRGVVVLGAAQSRNRNQGRAGERESGRVRFDFGHALNPVGFWARPCFDLCRRGESFSCTAVGRTPDVARVPRTLRDFLPATLPPLSFAPGIIFPFTLSCRTGEAGRQKQGGAGGLSRLCRGIISPACLFCLFCLSYGQEMMPSDQRQAPQVGVLLP